MAEVTERGKKSVKKVIKPKRHPKELKKNPFEKSYLLHLKISNNKTILHLYAGGSISRDLGTY